MLDRQLHIQSGWKIAGLRRKVPVVNIPTMSDRFDNQDIVVSVPRDDRTIVASTKFVVRIPAEFFEAMGGPVLRLVKFLY